MPLYRNTNLLRGKSEKTLGELNPLDTESANDNPCYLPRNNPHGLCKLQVTQTMENRTMLSSNSCVLGKEFQIVSINPHRLAQVDPFFHFRFSSIPELKPGSGSVGIDSSPLSVKVKRI